MDISGRIFRDVERLTSFSEDICAAGRTPGSRTLRLGLVSGRTIDGKLGDGEIVELVRVRSADAAPICIERTYLPRRTWALLEHAKLDRQSLYTLLEEHGERIVRSEEHLIARLASAQELDWLSLSGPAAVTAIARLCFDDTGEAVELTENGLLGDAYVFRFALSRTL